MLRILGACIGAAAVLLLVACSDNEEVTSSPSPTATLAAVGELAYLDRLQDWTDDFLVLRDEVGDVAGSADPFSKSNGLKVVMLTLAASDLRDEAYELDAPAKYNEAQMWVERASEAMDDSLDDIYLGLASSDADLIVSATDKLNTVNEYLDNAASALNAAD